MTAGSWLMASVCIDLMKHNWSTIFAVCGISSLTHAPELPCCAKLNCEGATGKLDCAAVMAVSRCPCRMESGSSVARRSLSFGL